MTPQLQNKSRSINPDCQGLHILPSQIKEKDKRIAELEAKIAEHEEHIRRLAAFESVEAWREYHNQVESLTRQLDKKGKMIKRFKTACERGFSLRLLKEALKSAEELSKDKQK